MLSGNQKIRTPYDFPENMGVASSHELFVSHFRRTVRLSYNVGFRYLNPTYLISIAVVASF
jgi:hypothetical protein